MLPSTARTKRERDSANQGVDGLVKKEPSLDVR